MCWSQFAENGFNERNCIIINSALFLGEIFNVQVSLVMDFVVVVIIQNCGVKNGMLDQDVYRRLVVSRLMSVTF